MNRKSENGIGIYQLDEDTSSFLVELITHLFESKGLEVTMKNKLILFDVLFYGRTSLFDVELLSGRNWRLLGNYFIYCSRFYLYAFEVYER